VRRRRDERGFTLIEILVAGSVASIGFLGLAALHATALRVTAAGRNITAATNLATQQIESMRRTPSAALADVPATTVTVGAQSFTRTAAVVAAGGAKQVTIDVNWTDQLGSQGVHLVTVIGPS